MTSDQKAWLDAHPDYRPVGVAGGHGQFVKRGTLKPDGTFVRSVKDAPPLAMPNGAFVVGVFQIKNPDGSIEQSQGGFQTDVPSGEFKHNK